MSQNLELDKDQLFFIIFALSNLIEGTYGNEMYKLNDDVIEQKTGFTIDEVGSLEQELRVKDDFSPTDKQRRLFYFALDRILNSEDGYGEEFETVVGLRKDASELLDLLKS